MGLLTHCLRSEVSRRTKHRFGLEAYYPIIVTGPQYLVCIAKILI